MMLTAFKLFILWLEKVLEGAYQVLQSNLFLVLLVPVETQAVGSKEFAQSLLAHVTIQKESPNKVDRSSAG